MRIEPGSTTRSPSPTSCSKKIAAIGVTYSWLNRMSVTTHPSSPGCTAGTPILPRDGSTTQWRAMIFSPSVIGRRAAPEPGDVEVEQSAVLDDAARDLALTLGEGGERDRLAAA